MAGHAGQDTVERLGSRDLNLDGEIINLAIVGSSRFYDFMAFEIAVESWVDDNGKKLVYFDNAATSQKPQCVIDSMSRYYEEYNSNAHRANHALAEEIRSRALSRAVVASSARVWLAR
jgi:hypothetical protein